MKILSPITGLHTAVFKETISTKKLIDLYQNELNVDVLRHFEGLSNIEMYQCTESSYKFYYPFQIAGDEQFYDELKIQLPLKYNAPYYSSDKWEYGRALNYISPADNVLEIGCGNGYFLEKLKKISVECSGLELNADSVNYANSIGLKVDLNTIEEFAHIIGNQNKFDVVCTFQVLEHIGSVKSFVDSCIDVLKPGGKLIIAVPYSKPFLFINDKFNTLNLPPHHMGLWNEVVFSKMQRFFNLDVNSIEIEGLANDGYDFLRFYEVNKDIFFPKWLPLKNLIDKIFWKFLKSFYWLFSGKNILVVYQKKVG